MDQITKQKFPIGALFIVILLYAAFWGVRITGPQAVSYLHEKKSFSVLNGVLLVNARLQMESYFNRALNFVRTYRLPWPNRFNEKPWDPWDTQRIMSQTKSLDYYQGELENALLGPIKSVLTGIALLIFSLKFLPKSTHFQFGLAIFGYFLLTRPEVLLNPPFGEGITGPFSDAIWLYQHSLNYIGLLYEDTVMTGGPQIYPTSLYTLFLAVLLKIIPSTKAFLILMHLFTFGMASAIVSLVRFFSLKVLNEKNSILTAILLVAFPLFQCMVELINLEMPMLFFATLSIYYLAQDKTGLACLWALASLFTKDPGIVACGAVLMVGLMRLFDGKDFKRRLKIFALPVLMMAIAAAKTLIRSYILGEQKDFCRTGFLLGWHNLNYLVWFYIFCVSVVLVLIKGVKHFLDQTRTFHTKVSELLNTHFSVFIMFLMAGLWMAVFNNFLTLAYRYELLLLPFLAFCLSYTLYVFLRRNERLTQFFLTGFIIFGFAASYGLVYYDRGESFPTNLERSLEYRNYLKLERALAREIEQNYSTFPIISPFQTAHTLAIPQLGYVTKPLDVTVYGMRATLGIKPYQGIHPALLTKTIWIGFPHHYEPRLKTPYPIDPDDKILRKIEAGRIEVNIFMGGFAIERMRRLILMYEVERIKNEALENQLKGSP